LSQKKEFVKDTFVYGLGSGIKKFIGFFLLPFYTRALAPADFGILDTMATSIFFLTAFMNMGLDSASGFYFFKGKDNREKGEILFTVFVLRLSSAIPALILSFFSGQISVILFGSEEYTAVVFFSCLFIPISLLVSEQSHLYRYYRAPWKYNIITIMQSLTSIFVGISLVIILKYGVLGAQIASVISNLVIVIFSYFNFARHKYTYHFSFTWAKKMLRYGFPLIWAGIASWFYVSSDRYFLLHYKNLQEIGYYSIGTTFSQPISLINMAVQMSYGILFYSMYNEETDPGKGNTRKLVRDVFSLFLFVTVIMASFLSIFGVEIINTITTPEYIPGALAIPLLTFSAIFDQAFQITSLGITLREKTWYFTIIIIITAIFNVGANFYFIPKYSFVGAGIATLLSYILYWALAFILSQKFFKVNFNLFRLFSFIIIAFSASCMVPFLQLQQNIQFHILVKSALLIVLILLPFVLKIVTYREVKNFLSSFKKNHVGNEKV
jgi:O-antigen/teichoic acid export membrane protein